jgi:hypothetical protein
MRWAFYIGCATAGLGLLGMAFALAKKQKTPSVRFIVAVLVGAGVAVTLYMMRADAGTYVPIHDVTTDLTNPPEFTVIPHRVYDPLIVPDRGRSDLADLDPKERWHIYHKEAYGDIGPLLLPYSVKESVGKAEAAARDMGWDIVAVVPEEGRIEATAETAWFGFKDDVVIRVREVADGSQVDVRSVSRIGISDVGANAKRIRKYLSHLQNKASQ